MHRQLKASMMCHENTWLSTLAWVLLGIRTALKEDLQRTVAELLYGDTLTLPGEFLASFKPSYYEQPPKLILK